MSTHTTRIAAGLILVIAITLSVVGCEESKEPVGGGGGDGVLSGAAVSVSGVDGLVNGRIPPGQVVTFRVRMENGTGGNVAGMTNGFRIYSSGGASWSQTSGEVASAISSDDFDLRSALPINVDGRNSDTIGFVATTLSTKQGMPAGFNDDALSIQIGPISSSYIGQSMCIDSCFYPNGNTWQWAPLGSDGGRPTWTGPHCYRIGN